MHDAAAAAALFSVTNLKEKCSQKVKHQKNREGTKLEGKEAADQVKK